MIRVTNSLVWVPGLVSTKGKNAHVLKGAPIYTLPLEDVVPPHHPEIAQASTPTTPEEQLIHLLDVREELSDISSYLRLLELSPEPFHHEMGAQTFLDLPELCTQTS